jgi:hypothetical protein
MAAVGGVNTEGASPPQAGPKKMSENEQRRHRRYDMSLPVKVKPASAKDVETSTSNISSAGIRFVMPEACEPGAKLEWELTLPLELCQGSNIRVLCQGRVVRIESTGLPGQIAVAASMKSYRFEK